MLHPSFRFCALHGLVDSKIVRIPVHQHHRFPKGHRFLFQYLQPLVESSPHLVRCRKVEMRIRLDHQHHPATMLSLRDLKRLFQPRAVCRISRLELRLAIIIRGTRNVEPGEQDIAMPPADVFGECSALAFKR